METEHMGSHASQCLDASFVNMIDIETYNLSRFAFLLC